MWLKCFVSLYTIAFNAYFVFRQYLRKNVIHCSYNVRYYYVKKSVIISEQLALHLYKIIRSASADRKFKYKKTRQRTVDTVERPVLHHLTKFYGDRSQNHCCRYIAILRVFLEKSTNSLNDRALAQLCRCRKQH